MSTEIADSELLARERDRRSSVRVRALLPAAFRRLDEREIAGVESRILDLAVLESETAFDEEDMWDQRSDGLRREVVLLLNEIRALRHKVSELEQQVEAEADEGLAERWITINDRGFWFTLGEEEVGYQEGELLEVRFRIPSLHTQRILAIGEVIRVDETDDETGVAVEFRSISEIHEQAIMRYALLRERQVARSERLGNLD